MVEKQAIFNLMGGRVRFSRGIYNPTSDAVWLAAFAPDAKTVMDVGIGTGGAALCFLANHPLSKITGIDISAAALAECAKNADINSRDIELINTDIMTWKTGRNFDLVITNPPYFKGTPAKHGAHHNVDLYKWTQKCIRRVKPRGYFCTIIDAAAIAEVISAMAETCGDITILPLFGAKNTAERVLIRGRLGTKTGSRLFSGMSMNNESVLRDGLTIDVILARL